jgi:spermidine synthase
MPPSPPLLELPGTVLNDAGERSSLRLLESSQCDVDVICAQIEGGSYGKPFIIEDGETRRLHFSLELVQSSMRIADPFALEFAYTRMMMAFVLFVPDPADVLLVGLGGGSLAKFCHRHLPRARLTVVEIDPNVIALRREFGIPDDPRLTIVQADAAEHLAAANGEADVLLLDGFDANGIASAFLNRGFYRAARRRLRPGGLVVANFAGPRNFWSRHLALLNDAFGGRVHVGTVPGGDNHIAFAFAEAGCPLDWDRLEERAKLLADQFPLDFSTILDGLREGAELRWAKAASAKALPFLNTKESHPCRKSTPT